MELCALCQNVELGVTMLTVKLLCLTVGQILEKKNIQIKCNFFGRNGDKKGWCFCFVF